jgi:hypothetical protein
VEVLNQLGWERPSRPLRQGDEMRALMGKAKPAAPGSPQEKAEAAPLPVKAVPAKRGDLDFEEALTQRVALLKGLKMAELEKIRQARRPRRSSW